MAAETLKWLFRLEDKMSDPAKKIADQLGRVDQGIKQATGSTDKMTRSARGGVVSLRGFGTAALGAGVALGGVTVALSAVTKVVGAVGNATKQVTRAFISSAASAETMQVSLEFLTGSAEEARKLAREAGRIGKAFALPDKQVLEGFKDLLGSGVEARHVPIVYQAMGDIEAMGGSPSAVLNLINKANALEKVTMTDLERITRSASLNIEPIYESLERQLGMSREGIEAMIRTSGLDSNTALNAMLDAIRSSTGGPLGSAMARQAETLEQQVKRLRSTWDNLIKSLNITDLPGIQMLKRILKSVNAIMDPTAAGGEKLRDVVMQIDQRIADFFARYEGDGGFAKLESDLLAIVETAGKVADAILAIVGALGQLGIATSNVLGKDHKDLTRGEKVLKSTMWGGLVGGIPGVIHAGVQHGQLALIRRLFGGSGSDPEAVANELGLEKYATGGLVARPTIALVGERGPELIVPLHKVPQMGKGSGTTISITNHITAAPGEDTESFAQRVSDILTLRIENIAMQQGALS